MEGLSGYPVYTFAKCIPMFLSGLREKLLAAPNLIYPQFAATHNAHTLAAIYHRRQNNNPSVRIPVPATAWAKPPYEQVTLRSGRKN